METTTTTIKYFLFEVRDSDGNDCTVYDAIVAATTREHASERLWKELAFWYPNDEGDGGYGTFHACDCECKHGKGAGECEQEDDDCDASTWECSHGGLLTNEDNEDGPYGVQEFSSESNARAAHTVTYFHSLIDLSEMEG